MNERDWRRIFIGVGDPPKILEKIFFYCVSLPCPEKSIKTRHSCIAFQNLVFYCKQVHKQFCRQVAMTTTTVIVEKLKYMFSTTGGVESFRASGDQHVIRKTLVTFLIFFLMRTWKKMYLHGVDWRGSVSTQLWTVATVRRLLQRLLVHLFLSCIIIIVH